MIHINLMAKQSKKKTPLEEKKVLIRNKFGAKMAEIATNQNILFSSLEITLWIMLRN